jgi:preprotein translocase subunit SecY
MENSMIKVPLQRVSIHNVHADQNYLAYKRAPMGIMPVMFASSAFLLPYYLVHMLVGFYPQNAALVSISDNMVLTRPLGVAVYLVLIVVLAVLFSFLMLNPRETAHQMQRNGDSIVGMYAGEQTRRFLTGIVLRWSLISGMLQACCMAVSLALSMREIIPAALAMNPTSMMIITSIVCSLVQEIASYYRYDAYRFFM